MSFSDCNIYLKYFTGAIRAGAPEGALDCIDSTGALFAFVERQD
jgi:hypothetical protein